MYGKLFDSVFDSSIMEEEMHTRYLFFCMIALADAEGVVDMTDHALARRVNLKLELVVEALSRLNAPDPSSRTPDEEGRRIVPLEQLTGQPFGWRIVNLPHYRKLQTNADRREYFREYKRGYRARQRSAETAIAGTPQALAQGDSRGTEDAAEVSSQPAVERTDGPVSTVDIVDSVDCPHESTLPSSSPSASVVVDVGGRRSTNREEITTTRARVREAAGGAPAAHAPPQGRVEAAGEKEEEEAKANSPAWVKARDRDRLLDQLSGSVPGFREQWQSWQATLTAGKKHTVWAQVLHLRTFREIATRRPPEEVLDMLRMAAARGWQGFEESWWIEQRERSRSHQNGHSTNGHGSPRAGPNRHGPRRPAPPGADEARRRQAAEVDRQLRLQTR